MGRLRNTSAATLGSSRCKSATARSNSPRESMARNLSVAGGFTCTLTDYYHAACKAGHALACPVIPHAALRLPVQGVFAGSRWSGAVIVQIHDKDVLAARSPRAARTRAAGDRFDYLAHH